MKVVNQQIPLKRRLSLMAVATLASAASFAATTTPPTPPPGSVIVQDFYADAGHVKQVGANAYGTCPQGPSPVSWGVQSKYSAYRIYTCPSTIQRIPKP